MKWFTGGCIRVANLPLSLGVDGVDGGVAVGVELSPVLCRPLRVLAPPRMATGDLPQFELSPLKCSGAGVV